MDGSSLADVAVDPVGFYTADARQLRYPHPETKSPYQSLPAYLAKCIQSFRETLAAIGLRHPLSKFTGGWNVLLQFGVYDTPWIHVVLQGL